MGYVARDEIRRATVCTLREKYETHVQPTKPLKRWDGSCLSKADGAIHLASARGGSPCRGRSDAERRRPATDVQSDVPAAHGLQDAQLRTDVLGQLQQVGVREVRGGTRAAPDP